MGDAVAGGDVVAGDGREQLPGGATVFLHELGRDVPRLLSSTAEAVEQVGGDGEHCGIFGHVSYVTRFRLAVSRSPTSHPQIHLFG